jgi:hypothetical protein
MRTTLGAVRRLIREEIREVVSEVWWGDKPDKHLMDDEHIDKKSMLVPDDIKDKIRKYFKAMHL